jgi:hypothetical protein
MDELGIRLAELAEEAAAGARPPGPAAARRRGRRRRLERGAGTLLLVVALLAGLVGLDRWVGPAPPTAGVAGGGSAPPVTWLPFEPPATPFRRTGPVVLVGEGQTNGDHWRLYGYRATRHGRDHVCLQTSTPKGGGGGTCQPAGSPVTVGTQGLGAPDRLVSGLVTERASTVRLELAVPGAAPRPLDVRPIPGGPSLPLDVYVVAVPRTRDIVRVLALDVGGRVLGTHEGFPAEDRLPPAGAVVPLGETGAGGGRFAVWVYEAEEGFTCLRVTRASDGEEALLRCLPPPPADRPAVEADGSCLGGPPDVGLLAGTAPRSATRVRVESDSAAAVEAPAFDAGERFGRAYWAVQVPDGATRIRVVALDERGAEVARGTTRHTQPICGPP